MTVLLESPWPALMLGLVVEVVLVMLFVRSGRMAMVAGMIVAAAVTLGLVLVERWVVTETEEVEVALDQLATALIANDREAVLSMFATDSPRRSEVQSALSRVTIRDARIASDLDVRINKLTIPPSASAYFTGRVDVRDTRGAVPYEHVIRRFNVTLHRVGGRWLIYDYADDDLRAKTGR